MASASTDNLDDTACDKCGAPASWADTSNLSWDQSLRHHLATFHMSPRMWPIGYILQSPYSPFWLEKEMPSHKSWRDAFEDLLALESGGQMISLESRKQEAKAAQHIRHSGIHHDVSLVNDQLKRDAKLLSLLKRMRDLATREAWADHLQVLDQAIPAQEESSKRTIAFGEGMIASLQKQMDKSWQASRYKMRGQWMLSLVSSGALPGWVGQLCNSSDGPLVSLGKIDRDPDGYADQCMTERELIAQFEEGIPLQLGGPSWSTCAGQYPELGKALEMVRDDVSIDHTVFQRPLAPSILYQLTTAERTKSDTSNLSTKVTLKNIFTDGTIEKKEVIDDASKVLEENTKVYASMRARDSAVNAALEEAKHESLDRQLKEHEENDELD